MTRNPPILGLNWKMHPSTREEANRILEGMSETLARMRHTQIMLFPPSIFFDYVREKETEYGLYCSMGVQDIGMTEVGAHTGQISAAMAADSGAECVLVGHSETRRRQALTDGDVRAKFEQAVAHTLNPILCVGYQEHTETQTVDYEAIRSQIHTVLEDKRAHIREYGVIIAYEPTWAIGSGVPADADTIETVAVFIRKQIAEIAGQDIRDAVYVLYGGSVNGDNASQLIALNGLDGFLVGGASLHPSEVEHIERALERCE